MLGLRFVVGLFEAGYWPALYYILGSWYNKREFTIACLAQSVCGARLSDWKAELILCSKQANSENATASSSRPCQSPQSLAASYRQESTTGSTAMLVLLGGDGFSVCDIFVSFCSYFRSPLAF